MKTGTYSKKMKEVFRRKTRTILMPATPTISIIKKKTKISKYIIYILFL